MEVATTENKQHIAKAILSVMETVKGIDKGMTIGAGNSAYKGIADKDVKIIIGKAMKENGLCILPTGIQKETTIQTWEEEDTWSKSIPKERKRKQSVFTEVVTEYLLLHESGESIVLKGFGQGVDPQDKGAGKATTYALKYALLYAFMVPTGHIDDADNTHSNDIKTPPAAPPATATPPAQKPPKIIDEEALVKILASDLKGLNDTLKAITAKKVIANAEQILQIQNKIIELKPATTVPEPANEATKPVTTSEGEEAPWINADQVNTALASPVKQLKSTINVIKKGKMKARATDLKLLEDKLAELEKTTK
jgi:hypothetical protein